MKARQWKVQDQGIAVDNKTEIMMAIEVKGDQSFTGSKIVDAIEKSAYDKAIERLKMCEKSLGHLAMHRLGDDGLNEVAGNGYEWVKITLKELGEI